MDGCRQRRFSSCGAKPAFRCHRKTPLRSTPMDAAKTDFPLPFQSTMVDVGQAFFQGFSSIADYWIDAAQPSALFSAVMRRRGNQYPGLVAERVPHLLNYGAERVVEGRALEPPVNYCRVRIVPPAGTAIDLKRRPFVVVDPRAGHGPGIGGFKADSEIGVIFKAGHPCYFVGFLPDPMPGQ